MPRDGGGGAETSIGPAVDATPAQRPERTSLKGRIVSVLPADAEAHGQALYSGSHGSAGEKLWSYMSEGPFPDFHSFQATFVQKAASIDPLFFTILDNVSGRPAGLAAYLRIEPIHRTIEVGHILYLPTLQRTAGATEAMYLMAKHVFEDLHYRRYEWKCNALNGRSRSAALRLGFTFEGVFRQHMIVKGRNRDTAWFSMLDCEWPLRKAALERWLSPSNFDEKGRQRESLTEMHAAVRRESSSREESCGPG